MTGKHRKIKPTKRQLRGRFTAIDGKRVLGWDLRDPRKPVHIMRGKRR